MYNYKKKKKKKKLTVRVLHNERMRRYLGKMYNEMIVMNKMYIPKHERKLMREEIYKS
jgi:hypothetical protein